MTKTIRTAIVGLGYWGPNLLRNFAAADNCEVGYGCDLDTARLAKFKKMYPTVTFTSSYEDVLKDASIDLVAIATPTSGHYPLAKQALEHDKHVLVEKPMTSTAAQAEELVTLAKKKGLHLFTDHTFFYSPPVRKIAELVTSGAIGKLMYVDSSRINLGLIQKDTNVLWDLAIHDLSIIGTFADLNTITKLYAEGRRYIGKQIEIGHLHLSFASGMHATVHVSWLSPVKLRQTIIAGDKKMILYDDTNLSEKVKVYDKGVHFQELAESGSTNPFFPVYRSGDVVVPALANVEELATEVAHIVRCLRGEEKPLMPPELGWQLVRILELANQSLESGQPVTVTPA